MGRRPPKSLRIDSVTSAMRRPATARRVGWASLVALPLACVLGSSLGSWADGTGNSIFAMLKPLIGTLLLFSPVAVLIAVVYLAVGGRPKKAALALDDGRLTLQREGHTQTIALDDIASGLLIPTAASSQRVDLHLESGNILAVHVDDPKTASELLDAAGVDPARRRFEMKLRRLFYQLLGVLVGVPVGVGLGSVVLKRVIEQMIPRINPAHAGFGAVGLAIVTAVALWRGFMGPDVVVGSDGIVVTYAFADRFMPYSSIERVGIENQYIVIQLKNGRRERVWAHIDDPTLVMALVARIHAAMHAEITVTAAEAFGLARDGRSFDAWREGLAALFEKSATYRHATLTREDVVRVLEDASAAAEARIAAALTLASSKDPETIARVRVAADACASEPVRVALQRAASGEIDEGDVERAVQAMRG